MSETAGILIGSKVTSEDVLRVSVEPPETPGERIIVTSNWCDKTTWFPSATRIVDEVADHDDPPGDYTQYSVAHTDLIDTYHGKISGEDALEDAGENSYRVTVKVNDTTKTEQDPHLGTGGDYTIDYAAGQVTFLTALTAPDVVKVTYHYATNSHTNVLPGTGNVLKIVKAEIQFSGDFSLDDTIMFEVLYDGTPVKFTRYKTIQDLYNEAQGVYPSLPALGGSGWRGITQTVYTLPFVYMAVSKLSDAGLLSLRLSLEHDVECGGTYATGTLYCLVDTE